MSNRTALAATANAVRWTPASIRKALFNPKPANTIPKNGRALAVLLGEALATDRPMTLIERRALAHLANQADIVTAAGRNWLIVPATPALIDTLAAIDAAGEDLEADGDAEDSHDKEGFLRTEWSPGEPFSQSVQDDDRELTTPENVDQTRIEVGAADDLEDEFEQRLGEFDRLASLMPGFAIPEADKHNRYAPWRQELRAKALAIGGANQRQRRDSQPG